MKGQQEVVREMNEELRNEFMDAFEALRREVHIVRNLIKQKDVQGLVGKMEYL